MKDINERLDGIEKRLNILLSFIFVILMIILLLATLTSCQTTSYIDSEIEQDKEIYLTGGGWERNDTTWNKLAQPSICEERGHIMPDVVSSTLMNCPPRIEETDSSTIKIYPGCNYITYVCLRCGQRVSEKEKEKRVIIWTKIK